MDHGLEPAEQEVEVQCRSRSGLRDLSTCGDDLRRVRGVDELEVVSDSELLVKQMRGEYRVKNRALQDFFLDASLKKRIVFKERHSIEVGADAFNLANHPAFTMGDQDINSVNFNRITGVTGNGARFLQFSLYYRF